MTDSRWDSILPRTLMFKRFFSLVKPNATAVQMVEVMKDCGLTNHVLETLPEAILIPLQDAIALCQPHPPSSWSDEMLELVKRTDISLILTSSKRPRPAMSNILVSSHHYPSMLQSELLIRRLDAHAYCKLGIQIAL